MTLTVVIPSVPSRATPFGIYALANLALNAGIPTGTPIPAAAYERLVTALQFRNPALEPFQPSCTYVARCIVAEEVRFAAQDAALKSARSLYDEFVVTGTVR